MQEKIIIKSKVNESVKKFFCKGIIISFAIAVLCTAWITAAEGWDYMLEFYRGVDIFYFILFLIGAVSLLFSIVLSIIYLPLSKCELQITESSVTGKALFGKKVVLPLYMVSAYSTRKFCSVIAVATASGITKFALIGNYKEISEVLAKRIRELQQPGQTNTQATSGNTSLDDLVKLKSLLDSGIISQEEFDSKKKQLLGL